MTLIGYYYDVDWCRENLFMPKNFERYLKSERYLNDVKTFAQYENYTNLGKMMYTNVGGIIADDIYLTSYQKHELFEILIDNCSGTPVILSVLNSYLNKILCNRFGHPLNVLDLVEYNRIVKMFIEHSTSKMLPYLMLDNFRQLNHDEHFNVSNILFHAGINIVYIKYSFNHNTSSITHLFLRKLLQTDVRIENDVKLGYLLASARYNRSIENTLIFALLIEFS